MAEAMTTGAEGARMAGSVKASEKNPATGAASAPAPDVPRASAPPAAAHQGPARLRAPHGDPRDRAVPDPRGANGVARCWELRGCAGLFGLYEPMERECPHATDPHYAVCPTTCTFSQCERPWHRLAQGLDLLDPTVDRFQAVKEQCRTCAHFIAHGPRVGERPAPPRSQR